MQNPGMELDRGERKKAIFFGPRIWPLIKLGSSKVMEEQGIYESKGRIRRCPSSISLFLNNTHSLNE